MREELTEKMAEALEILEAAPAPAAKITSSEHRTIFHATIAHLAGDLLIEPTMTELEQARDLFRRPLWQITDRGRDLLGAWRELHRATVTTTNQETSR